MQEIYFFFDDSGVLHSSNTVQKFVYAGYVFESRNDLDKAKRKYRALLGKIKKELNRSDEIKAFGLKSKYKRALFNVMRNEESMSVVVDICKVYPQILASAKSICRYKDFILKMAIKTKLRRLIDKNIIDPTKDITIKIYIDEQLTSTDGIYSLKESVKEELQYGISNFNYGNFHPPLFSADVFVEVVYCESKNNYMIQACDILANRIFASYKYDRIDLRTNIPKCLSLTFP